ncbi:MAG: sulfoxide reductase heme-binding subunit YedZ [Chloroflexi bacterium]|nr:MAG: sulfoxide reductase heme-binding subunit YedZ [Chloroflexota bacterium]
MKVWISEKISKPWRKNKKILASILHLLIHVGSLLPLLVGLWDFWQGNLGANPILEVTHRSGKTALTTLILSLSITPLRQLLKWNQINKLRRPLGLYAAFYAGVHLSIYVILDYGFLWGALLANSLTNKFILVGSAAGTILLVLAITSLNLFRRKMGASWKQLHRFVYGAGVLAGLHFILAVKPGVLRPWPYAAILLLLLSYRLPPVQTWVKKTR